MIVLIEGLLVGNIVLAKIVKMEVTTATIATDFICHLIIQIMLERE